MSLMIAGSTTFDTIETPTGRVDRVLGGSGIHAALAASVFGPVRYVSAVGHDFPDAIRQTLRSRGIDLAGMQTIAEVKTQFWHGRYLPGLHEREHLAVDLDIFDHYNAAVPGEYQDSEYVLLAHHWPLFQLRILDQLRSPKFVMMDTIDHWIHTAREPLEEVIEQVTAVVVNETEARLLANEVDLARAANWVLDRGPKYVIIKQGAQGSLLATHEITRHIPAYPTTSIDPTGAGDTYAGGLMGWLAQHPEDWEAALIAGTVLASLNVEQFGSDAMMSIEPATWQRRWTEYLAQH